MGATLKDIAREAGLAVSTVSMVLGNKPNRIPAATRERIFAIASKLSYKPNQMAVGLITRKTMRVGVLVDDISNSFFSEVAKGAEVEADKRSFSTLLMNIYTVKRHSIADRIKKLIGSGVDGLLLGITASGDDAEAVAETIAKLQGEGVPVVFVGKPFSSVTAPNVEVDNEKGGYLAATHLLERGHRKIGCVTGPMSPYNSRFYGYIRALQEYGVGFDPYYIYDGDFRLESGCRGAESLVEKGASAIFACNDLMAYGVYQFAMENQIKVPGQLSIVGYDDLAPSKLLFPPLTTVRQPAFEIGRMACDKILEMIDTQSVISGDYSFEPELIVRGSTAMLPDTQ